MTRFGIFLTALLCLGLVSGVVWGQGNNDIVEVETIAELRAGETDGTVYKLTGEAILTYQQGFRNKKWVQDSTAAIEIDDSDGIITTEYNRYDGITGLTGTLNVHNQLLQFVPTEDPGDATSTGNVIIPEVLTLDEVTSDHQSQLVRLEGVSFIDTGTFETGTNYSIYDDTDTLTYRTNFFESDYIGDAIPETYLHLATIVHQFHDNIQVTARDWGDIEIVHHVTFNVDMSEADPFDPEVDDVYISGTIADWAEPGSDPDFKMEPTDDDANIYSLSLFVNEGEHAYKYFRVIDDTPSWDNGEWDGDPNRLVLVNDDMVINDVWGAMDEVQQALIVASSETTMDLTSDTNQVTVTITYPDEFGDALTDEWRVDGIVWADEVLVAGTEIHFTYNDGDVFEAILEDDLEAGEYIYLSDMLPEDAPTRTALIDHAGRTDVWDFHIISPISVETELTMESITSDDGFSTYFLLEDGSIEVTIEADIYKALELTGDLMSLELFSGLNYLAATVSYPETFFDVITDDWKVDAAITSSDSIVEGTILTFTYNEGAEFEFEFTEDVPAGEIIFLSDLLPAGADVRTPLIDHANRTDLWEFEISSPVSAVSNITVYSVTSDDDFESYVVLAEDTEELTVISESVYNALALAANDTHLELESALNEVRAVIAYPDTLDELITDIWEVDAAITFSVPLGEGTEITTRYLEAFDFEVVLEEDVPAGEPVLISELLPDAIDRGALVELAGRVDVWEFFFAPVDDFAEVNVDVMIITSADNFENYFVLEEGEITTEFIAPRAVTFYVDMRGSGEFDPETDDVYMGGSMFDWDEPGTNPDAQLEPEEAYSKIYSITLGLIPGTYEYKFFRVIDDQPSWDYGEWPGDPNRSVDITEDAHLYHYWSELEVDAMPIVMARNILPEGSHVTIEGVVTRVKGAFTRIQDETAGYVIRSTGDRLWREDVEEGEIRDGDIMQVTGITSTFASLWQINDDDVLEYTRVDREQPLPEPIQVTLEELAANGQQYESMLVFVNELEIDDDGDEVFGENKSYQLKDPTVDFGEVDFRLPWSSDSEVPGTQIPNDLFSFTGVVGQFDGFSGDPTIGFQLMAIYETDIGEVVSVDDQERTVPVVYQLEQNYPNPFNPSTTIDFSIPEQVQVTLEIYNVLGQRVKTLVAGEMYDPGHYNVVWDGRNQNGNPVSSGMYIYRIQAGDFMDVKKMMFLK